MSLLVTGIRLPFDEPETAALDRARRLTGLLSSETEAAVCRVSIDARRGQISRVYSVRLDAPCDEKALAEKLQMPSVRYKENVRPAVPHGEKRLAHRPVVSALPDCSRRTRSPGTASARSYSSAAAIWTSATGR